MKKQKRNRLPGLLVLLIIVAGIAIYIASPGRSSKRRLSPLNRESSVRPQIAMRNIHQTHIRQGEKKWALTADNAQLAPDGNLSTLDNIMLTAFKAAGPPVEITADQGAFNRTTRQITVSGNVIINDKNYIIRTPSLHYDNEAGIIYTTEPVTIDPEAT